MEKRTKELKIRLTETEYQALLERKTKARLAEWVRETALNQTPKRKPKPTDPELLYQLNRIGVNLNQIARQCNALRPSLDLVRIGIELREINQVLRELNDRQSV